MKEVFNVFRIFASNIFSFGNYWEGFKKGPKEIIKNLVIALLALYGIGTICFSYGTSCYLQYEYFKSIDAGFLMPLSSIFMAFLTTSAFGFVSVASNYYTGYGDEHFLAMPLKSADIFGAKVAVSFVTEAGFGIMMMVISSAVYAGEEGFLTNPFFYVGSFFSIILVGLFSVMLVYFLLILVLTIFPGLRKKNILSGVSVFFIVAFALAYGLLFGSSMPSVDSMDSGFQIKMICNMMVSLSKSVPFLLVFSKAICGDIVSIMIEVLMIAALIFLAIPVLSRPYVRSLNGFSDVKTKKIDGEKAEKILQNETKSQSVFKALYLRDVKTIFREPAFFSNGPLILFLFPVILLFSCIIGFISAGDRIGINEMRDELSAMVGEMKTSAELFDTLRFYIVLVAGGFAAFLGNATGIAVTSFSREGKSLYDLKSMPIETETLVGVKFFHAISYCFVGGIISDALLVAINVFIRFTFDFSVMIRTCLFVLLMAMSFSILPVFIDMFVDAINPKLQWENPIVAYKQNLNSLFAVLIELLVIAVFVVLGLYCVPKTENGILILCVIGLILGVPAGNLYMKYVKRKMPEM